MPLLLNEEQVMLQDSARDFISTEAPVDHLRHLRDSKERHGLSLGLWKNFAHMGYAGILIPESQGGIDLGFVEVAVIQEQIGRSLVPTPFLATSILAVTALRRAGSAAQRALYLPAISEGNELFAVAIDEHSKHAPHDMQLTATAERSGYVLNGTKRFVLDGHIAHQFVVIARTSGSRGDTDGPSLFVVPASSPGLRVERILMVDNHNAAHVHFDSVAVDSTAVLGDLGNSGPLLSGLLDVARSAASAELLGVATEAFERTLKYLKERMQFGHKIGEYQALQHRAARMFGELEQLRAAVMKSAQALAENLPDSARFVSIAKAKAGRVAKLCTEEAIQMHGGIGLTDELDLGFFLKRARVLNELFGDHRFHADRLGRLNGY